MGARTPAGFKYCSSCTWFGLSLLEAWTGLGQPPRASCEGRVLPSPGLGQGRGHRLAEGGFCEVPVRPVSSSCRRLGCPFSPVSLSVGSGAWKQEPNKEE